MMCSVCYDEKCEFFSPRIGYSDQQNVAFEINPSWSCLAMMLEKATRICIFGSVVGMQGVDLTTFQDHDIICVHARARAPVCVCVCVCVRARYHCDCQCPFFFY